MTPSRVFNGGVISLRGGAISRLLLRLKIILTRQLKLRQTQAYSTLGDYINQLVIQTERRFISFSAVHVSTEDALMKRSIAFLYRFRFTDSPPEVQSYRSSALSWRLQWRHQYHSSNVRFNLVEKMATARQLPIHAFSSCGEISFKCCLGGNLSDVSFDGYARLEVSISVLTLHHSPQFAVRHTHHSIVIQYQLYHSHLCVLDENVTGSLASCHCVSLGLSNFSHSVYWSGKASSWE